MLFRKFASHIEAFLRDEPHKILLINGARQIGKSFLIRYVCKGMFRNYIELNLKEDKGVLACWLMFAALMTFTYNSVRLQGNDLVTHLTRSYSLMKFKVIRI